MFNSHIKALIEKLCILPGVGEKTAERYAFGLVKMDINKQKTLGTLIHTLDENIHYCPECQNFSDEHICEICENTERNQTILCIVETPFDVLAIEKTSVFKGKYHVLHGILSPIDGVRPDNLKIKELMIRLQEHPVNEIIFALSPSLEGDATMNYIKKELPGTIQCSHIARGIPTGASIEYADHLTLIHAFQDRQAN
ncbi:recombination protein RecR [Candidatus Peregrinibacteria bacterium]|nr:MAG: recombination protein RecR [Candidatus Peregrinibacteria bacterium]